MLTGFYAYGSDCTIHGEVDLEADRFKDMLDEHARLVILRATLDSLDDDRVVCVPRLELERHELLAVEAELPRGHQERRIRTVRHRMLATVGPYTVAGELHEKPGVAPMTAFHSARPMISFTDATISFMRGGRTEDRYVATLLVNRDHVAWAEPDTRHAPLDLPLTLAAPALPVHRTTEVATADAG
jgi:hypothetical protein